MNSERMLRAAVIGLGNIGFMFDLDPLRKDTWSHVTAYKKCHRVILAGAVEVDEKKIALFNKHHNAVPVYRGISDLMSCCCPDIVSICTPTASHYSVLRELTQYPVKGIFCEKPLSCDIEEAAEMVRLCDEKGIVLAVNHIRRWDDHFLYVKAVIQSGEIGKIRTINMTYPGQIFNIGTHLLDALRMLTGSEPVKVSGVSTDPDKDDPDIGGWLQFNDRSFCTINSVGKREDLVLELDFIGDKGRVRMLDNGETIEKYHFQESTRYSGYSELRKMPVESIEKKDRFTEAVFDLASVIEGEKDHVNCTGYDGLASLKLILALIESARRNGSPIKLLLRKQEEDKYE